MDLNTLIATIVTATAALIAIIGGFLISRVITLSSEQNGVRRRLREIRLGYHTQARILSEVEESILAEDREEFITDYYTELIFDKVSPGELLNQSEEFYSERKVEDFQDAVKDLYRVNSDLEEIFGQQNISYSDDLPSDFSEFVKKGELAVENRYYWYELLYNEHRSRMSPKPKGSRGIFEGIESLNTVPSFNNMSITMQSQAKQQAYQQKLRDRDMYKNELSHLKSQEDEQVKILIDYGKPRGMWGGLVVLIYASIVGIGYPITLLPYPEGTYDDEITKFVLLFLFFSQLIVLFVYLGFNMHRLTKEENKEEEILS